MSIGRINTQIQIVQTVTTKDDEGFSEKADVVLASVHAYREGRHGSERWVDLTAFSDCTDLFRFRVIPSLAVTTELSILCGTERFQIISVENIRGRNMYLEVLAKKVVTSHG